MSVLKKPLITEKASALNESGKYGFIVDKNAMKYQVKSKSRFTKSKVISGRTAGYKKAIVTVKDGEVIDFYSGI